VGEMNDDRGQADWGDISDAPAKKSQIPKITCCCLGCALPLLLVGVLGLLGVNKAVDGTNSDLQWPQVDEILPVVDRPDDLTLIFGLQLEWFNFEFYLFVDSPEGSSPQQANRAWILMQLPAENGAFLAACEPWEASDRDEPLTRLEVQGQFLGVGWLKDSDSAPIPPGGYWGGHGGEGPSIVVELPSLDPSTILVLLITGVDMDEATADEVIAFLDHFQIGSAD